MEQSIPLYLFKQLIYHFTRMYIAVSDVMTVEVGSGAGF